MWRVAMLGSLLAAACSGGGGDHHAIDAPAGVLDAAVDGAIVDASVDARPGRDAGTDAGVDAGRLQCAPSGGCLLGPPCGNRCCGQGERCENGACRCGINPACAAGLHCAAPGPVGGDSCGAICCGGTIPCPL